MKEESKEELKKLDDIGLQASNDFIRSKSLVENW